MDQLIRVAVAFLLLVCSAFPTFAGSPYDQDLRELSGELRSLMLRADQIEDGGKAARYELQDQLFELSKRLHRLQEEAMSANTQLQRRHLPRDRGLTYAAAVAHTLDLARAHTDSYVETRDQSFRAAAATTARVARDLLAGE